MEGRRSGTADRPQYGARRKASGRMSAQDAASGQSQKQNNKVSTRNARPIDELKCFECGGVRHYARECPFRRNRLNPRNPPRRVTVTHLRDPQCDTLGIRRGDPRDGTRTSRWETNKGWNWRQLLSSLSFSKRCWLSHCAGVCTAKRTHHPGNYCRFPQIIIVDTSSSIFLIQSGVCSNEVRVTSISHSSVTCDKLRIKGVQAVEFHLN
jgi:hypothetical protein